MSEQTAGPSVPPSEQAASPGPPSEQTAGPTGPQPVAGGRSRARQVGMDMIRSMGLVAVVLGLWLWFSHPRTPDEIHTVEWYATAQSASQVASYEVMAPPESFGWSATSARVEPQPDGTIVWRAGFYTPDEEYAGLLQRGVFPEQAKGSVDEWVAEQTRDGEAGETVSIDGREWTRLEGDPTPDERRSLVAVEEGTVTVVTGSAPWSELEELAGSLEPVKG